MSWHACKQLCAEGQPLRAFYMTGMSQFVFRKSHVKSSTKKQSTNYDPRKEQSQRHTQGT